MSENVSNKTCGECCGFSESENRCLLLGGRGIAYADNEACRRFSEKKPIPPPTNGDVIRKMSNEKLVELFDNSCKVCAKDIVECDTDCVAGILAWLNAPAESEVSK